MPGGPRGLQNRRRRASGGAGSIPVLSAFVFSIVAKSLSRWGSCQLPAMGRYRLPLQTSETTKEVNRMSREQIRKLTALSSCAG